MPNLLAHYLSEETCRHSVEETAGIIGSNKANVIEYRDRLGNDGFISVWTYRPASEDDLGGPDRVAVRVSPAFRNRRNTLYGKPKENSVMEKGKGNNKNKLDGTEKRVPYEDLTHMRLLRYWGKRYAAYHKSAGRDVEPFVAGARDRADAKRLLKFTDAQTAGEMVAMFLSARYMPPEPVFHALYLQRFEVLKSVTQNRENKAEMLRLEKLYPPKPEKPRGPETITWKEG
jgi:hypothetical protein